MPGHSMKTFVLPAIWASYLINGDSTGLQQDADGTAEIDRIDRWLLLEELGPCLGCSEEPFFTWRPDGPLHLGAECLDFQFEGGTRADLVPPRTLTGHKS